MGETSDDDELDDWGKKRMDFVDTMDIGLDEVDQRLL